MPVHWSLGFFLANGYGITAFCEAPGDPPCRHSQALDLTKLIEAFGPDFIIPNEREKFVSRLRCSKCGSRHVSIIITSPGGIGQTTGH